MRLSCILLVLLAAAIVVCGCTTAPAVSPVPSPAPASVTPLTVPSLIGTWAGPVTGYTEGIGYRDSAGKGNITFIVTSQEGRVFCGRLEMPLANGSVRTDKFSGIITPDYRNIRMVEFETAEHSDGWILDENHIELIFMETEQPESIYINALTRIR